MKNLCCILALIAAALVAVRLWIDRDPPVPLAEIYNSHTKDLTGFVVAIEKEHKFPNGQVEEGWLIQDAKINGSPIWSVKPKKAEVVWR